MILRPVLRWIVHINTYMYDTPDETIAYLTFPLLVYGTPISISRIVTSKNESIHAVDVAVNAPWPV